MPEDELVEIYLNPLSFLLIEEPYASQQQKEPSFEDVLNFICAPGTSSDLKSIVYRYNEINNGKIRLYVAPYEQRFLDKLIWPLRSAKGAYMCSNYLSTIALCGMVAEMVALLLFEITPFFLNATPMTEKEQVSVFGRKYEKLGQDRRVQILAAYSVVDDEHIKAFESIRTTRNRYLHLWSQDHERLPFDAVKSFQAAVFLVVNVIGQNVKDGKLILNPSLLDYLKRSGTFKAEE